MFWHSFVLVFYRRSSFSEPTPGPQGGILSPLLANIALSAIEERYERHVWPRQTPTLLTDAKAIATRARYARKTARTRGAAVLFPIRYADDFIILVSVPPGPEQDRRAGEVATQEKAELAAFLKERLGLDLSEAKTLVTPVTSTIRFLGHHVRVRAHPSHGRLVSTAVIPKDRSLRFRELIKDNFARSTLDWTLGAHLKRLNPVLRRWSNFYRHAWGAKKVFNFLDHYVWWTILRWLRKKHHRTTMKYLRERYGWRKPGGRSLRWRDGGEVPYELARVPVEHFKLGWLKAPDFAATSMESPVHNERCTPGSEGGARKPT